MDQAALGYKDGSVGIGSFEVPLNHFKNTCEKDHDVKPNIEAIKNGFNNGKRFYCSESGAINAGISGLKYTGVCSKEEEKIFFEKYNPARMSYLEKKVKDLESENSTLRTQLMNKDSEISTLQSEKSSLMSAANNCNHL